MLESMNAGVPVLTIPLFADQFRHASTARRHKVGRTLEKRDINEPEKIIQAIETILNDTR